MSVDIPKEGWAGVVVNEGPDFKVEVQKLPVPEPSKCLAVFDRDMLTLVCVQRTMSFLSNSTSPAYACQTFTTC